MSLKVYLAKEPYCNSCVALAFVENKSSSVRIEQLMLCSDKYLTYGTYGRKLAAVGISHTCIEADAELVWTVCP